MQQGGNDPSNKTSRVSQWGNSLMLGLSALTRNRRKRIADKSRRQAERRDLKEQLKE